MVRKQRNYGTFEAHAPPWLEYDGICLKLSQAVASSAAVRRLRLEREGGWQWRRRERDKRT